MAEIVYLANVGTRDLTVDGQTLTSPREDGEKLLEEYLRDPEAVGQRLNAPILLPGLRRAAEAAGRIDRLVLFASDQPETTLPKYRNFDTVFLGEILRRWLPTCPDLAGRLQKVVLVRIPGNPADYNNTIPFYERELPNLVPETAYMVYVAPVGGADASNVALWLAAVRRFRTRVEVIYVTPEGRVEEVPLARLLLREQVAQQARTLLDHYDYAALARLLEEDSEWGATWRPDLARALAERLHFHFAGAAVALKRALARASGAPRAWLGRLLEEMQQLREVLEAEGTPPRAGEEEAAWARWLARQRTGLAELYWNLCIKAERAEWVDFLGRAFRLVEGMLRLAFEAETHHNTDRIGEGFPDFAAYLEGQPALRAFLTEQGMRLTGPEGPAPTTRLLAAILRYWVEHGGRGRALGPAYKAIKAVQTLADLRNRTIIAHGWQGVGEEEIRQAAGHPVGELLELLRWGLKALGVPVEVENPYRRANDEFRRHLAP